MTTRLYLLTITFFCVAANNDTIFTVNVTSYSNSTTVIPNGFCSCMPFYQCSEDLGEIITDGSGLLDLRTFKDVCSGDFDVCCNVTKDALATTTEKPSKPRGCGYHDPGSYPWYAALLYQSRTQFTPSYKCGVSVIHEKVVLTAAHCLIDEGHYAVRVGNLIRRISSTAIHPKFNEASLQNDIALIFLEKPVDTTSDLTAAICIASTGVSLDNTGCVATGSISGPHGNPQITKIKLPIVPRDKCGELLRSTRLGEFFQLHKSFICAGGKENEDTCGGDGGSPLICPVQGQPGRFHQVGIVSWGIGCGNSNVPGVYVNLPYFRQWIDRIMISNGLDVTSYRY